MIGAWRQKHVEWLCRNKTCTVLHQVGFYLNYYYDERKHKIKIWRCCTYARCQTTLMTKMCVFCVYVCVCACARALFCFLLLFLKKLPLVILCVCVDMFFYWRIFFCLFIDVAPFQMLLEKPDIFIFTNRSVGAWQKFVWYLIPSFKK